MDPVLSFEFNEFSKQYDLSLFRPTSFSDHQSGNGLAEISVKTVVLVYKKQARGLWVISFTNEQTAPLTFTINFRET